MLRILERLQGTPWCGIEGQLSLLGSCSRPPDGTHMHYHGAGCKKQGETASSQGRLKWWTDRTRTFGRDTWVLIDVFDKNVLVESQWGGLLL